MLVRLELAGPAVIAPVTTQFKVSLPEPPLITSKEVNVPAGALYVSLPEAPRRRDPSTPVVSGRIMTLKKVNQINNL